MFSASFIANPQVFTVKSATKWDDPHVVGVNRISTDQTFSFPEPHDGKNMVLIGGMNGHGKTTLLEAIYLCLYGEDAVTHLARAGLKENAYVKFLQGALHGRSHGRRGHAMRVCVRFMVQGDYGFGITRTWYFDPTGKYRSQEVRLDEIRDGVPRPINAEEKLSTVLQEHVVPAHLAPFFFFDGEEVKKLADQDQNGWVKQGMESLMGVVLVRNLRERLLQYQNNRRQGATAKDKAEIDKMLSGLKAKETARLALEEEWKQCVSRVTELTARQTAAQERLINLGAGNGNIKSVEDTLREEGEKKRELDECEKSLEKLLGDRLPFHLAAPDLLAALRERLSAEHGLIEWEDRKKSREPDKERFTRRFFESERLTHLGRTELSGLHMALDEAWESLYWPRPEGCAEALLHGYLEPRQRQRLEDAQSAVRVSASQIRELVGGRSRIRARLKELENRRLQLQGVDDDGTLRKLNEELKTIQAELNETNRQRGDLERQRTSQDAGINQARADYERENARYLQAEPAQSVARKAERVKDMVDELLPRLFDLKTRELSVRVTVRFKSLAHRDWIDRVEIRADGSTVLLGQDGKEVRFDRSAGENQIFATALFAGLADVSGYRIPLVVDTPMARLDSTHRQNLLDYWHSDPARQVILLSQDKEVDENLARSLSPFLAKTYLLESQAIGDGLYRTVAREGYFGGVL
jgi:DNA sulfur modification protein DndD